MKTANSTLERWQEELDQKRGKNNYAVDDWYRAATVAYTLIRYAQQPWYKRLRRFQ